MAAHLDHQIKDHPEAHQVTLALHLVNSEELLEVPSGIDRQVNIIIPITL